MAQQASQGLQFNGISQGDSFATPSITFDEVTMYFSQDQAANTFARYFSESTYYFQRNNSNNENWSFSIKSLYVNGVDKSGGLNTPFITQNQRTLLDATLTSALTGNIYFFSDASNKNNMHGTLYTITIKNAGTVVAHYDFTNPTNINGSTVLDSSGNGNNGTLYGSPQWAVKPEAQGLQMNGASSNPSYVLTPSITFDTIIMDCYVDPAQTTTYAYLASGNNYPVIRYQGNNNWYETTSFTTATGLTVGSRTTIKLVTSSAFTGSMYLFNRSSVPAGGYALRGVLYDAKFYNAGTLVAHYDCTANTVNGSTIKDLSGNGNDGTINNIVSLNKKPSAQGTQFGSGGTSSYFSIPNGFTYNQIQVDYYMGSNPFINQYIAIGSTVIFRVNQGTSVFTSAINSYSGFVSGERTTLVMNINSTSAQNLKLFYCNIGAFVGTAYSAKFYNDSTLVAYYDFTSSTPTKDLSGNGYDGTLYGNTQQALKSTKRIKTPLR